MPLPVDDVKKLVLAGKCVAFLGAGLFAQWVGDWRGLVQDIAAACGVPPLPGADLLKTIDACVDADEAKCNATLRVKLPHYTSTTRVAMDRVLRLPFRAILTTNFDPWLRQQARQEHFDEFHVFPDLPIHQGISKRIYYLHGYFDSHDAAASVNSLIFGQRSFESAYASSLLPGFLLNVLTYARVVFIGFNPLERNMSKLIEASHAIRREIAMRASTAVPDSRHFAIVAAPDVTVPPPEQAAQAAHIDQIRALGVEPVLYDRQAPDHRGLDELLSNWVEEGDLKTRMPPFKSGFDD